MAKKNKIWLLILVGILVFTSVLGYVWYNFIYNPVDSRFLNKNSNDIYDAGYYSCMQDDYSKDMKILRDSFCKCVARTLTDEFYGKAIRKKEGLIKYYNAVQGCQNKAKFSTASNKDLKDAYERHCKNNTGAYQSKYCECYANNIVYFIREYAYESAIIRNYDTIVEKAVKSCIGHYMKKEKL